MICRIARESDSTDRKILREPPVGLDHDLPDFAGPADRVRSGLQHREVAVHVIVPQVLIRVGLLQHRVYDNSGSEPGQMVIRL